MSGSVQTETTYGPTGRSTRMGNGGPWCAAAGSRQRRSARATIRKGGRRRIVMSAPQHGATHLHGLVEEPDGGGRKQEEEAGPGRERPRGAQRVVALRDPVRHQQRAEQAQA